jgi:hypothetical protein
LFLGQPPSGVVARGKLSEIDPAAIGEEIDDAGEGAITSVRERPARADAASSQVGDHQPDKRSRSSTIAIRQQRRRAGRQLPKNPGFESRLCEALLDTWMRHEAASETGFSRRKFLAARPFEFVETMDRADCLGGRRGGAGRIA